MKNRQPTPEQMATLATHGGDVHDWAVQNDRTLRVTMYDDSTVYIKPDGKHDRQREREQPVEKPAPKPAPEPTPEPEPEPTPED
jgi:hypothetical protein